MSFQTIQQPVDPKQAARARDFQQYLSAHYGRYDTDNNQLQKHELIRAFEGYVRDAADAGRAAGHTVPTAGDLNARLLAAIYVPVSFGRSAYDQVFRTVQPFSPGQDIFRTKSLSKEQVAGNAFQQAAVDLFEGFDDLPDVGTMGTDKTTEPSLSA